MKRMVPTQQLRDEFAKRLAQACDAAEFPEWGRGSRLARMLGVTTKAVSKWLLAESMPRRELMIKLAALLGVDVNWLEYGEQDEQEVRPVDLPAYLKQCRKLPILGKVSKFGQPIDYPQMYEVATEYVGQNAFWLEVEGSSMATTGALSFNEGVLILVDPMRECNNGDFVLAYTENKTGVTFRQLVIEPEGKFLVPLNPDPFYKRLSVEQNSCELIGRVVAGKIKLIRQFTDL